MSKAKQEEIGARVPVWMKEAVQRLAVERGQNESVIVRDALREYLRRNSEETKQKKKAA